MTQNIAQQIHFFHISKSTGEDLCVWVQTGSFASKFTLDLIAVKSMIKTPEIYYQMRRSGIKICSFTKNGITFVIGSEDDLQYQLLEAAIDKVMDQFVNFYGVMLQNYSGDVVDTFNGFPEIIGKILNEIGSSIAFLRADCNACKSTISVCVKKSLVNNASNYPVSLVYIHNGHGLLIYIDKNFKVRGAEILICSG
jgi:hypothetical protein